MSGRRPKPTAMKKLAGNPGRRPLNASEPEPEAVMPEMPKGMGHIANREWRWLAPALLEVGCITKVDGKSFAEYCKAVAMSETYYREALREPMVEEPIFGKDGVEVGSKIKVNPAMAAYVSASKLAKTYLIEFGLTPASRSKLHIDKPKEIDPFEEAMGKRGMKPIEQSQHDAPQPVAFDTGKISDASINFDA